MLERCNKKKAKTTLSDSPIHDINASRIIHTIIAARKRKKQTKWQSWDREW